MKITRKHLRRIIKEELSALRETFAPWDIQDPALASELAAIGNNAGWSLVVLKDLLGISQHGAGGVTGTQDYMLLKTTVGELAKGFPMYLGRPDLETLASGLQDAVDRGIADEDILGEPILLPPDYGVPRPIPDDYDPIIVNERKKNLRRRRKYKG